MSVKMPSLEKPKVQYVVKLFKNWSMTKFFLSKAIEDFDENDFPQCLQLAKLEKYIWCDTFEKLKSFSQSQWALQRKLQIRDSVAYSYEICHDLFVEKLLPLIAAASKDAAPIVRIEFCNNISQVATILLQGDFDSGHQKIVKYLAPCIESCIFDSEYEVQTSACTAASNVALQLKLRHRLNFLLPYGQMVLGHDSLKYRRVAPLLVATLLDVLGPDECSINLLYCVYKLADDVDPLVRKNVAEQFPAIGKCLPQSENSKSILNLFCQLCEDNDDDVRKTCAQNIFHMAKIVKMSKRRNNLAECLRDLLHDSVSAVKEAAQRWLGAFISTLCSPSNVPAWMFDQYKKICIGREKHAAQQKREKSRKAKANEKRRQKQKNTNIIPTRSVENAFSFACVTQTLGVQCWIELQQLFTVMVSNEQRDVRRSIAMWYHILSKSLIGQKSENLVMNSSGDDSNLTELRDSICRKLRKKSTLLIVDENTMSNIQAFLYESYLTLLSDKDGSVKYSALSHLGEILELFDIKYRKLILTKIDEARINSEFEWRLRECITEHYASMCELLDINSIQNIVFPMALRLCQDSIGNVRTAAANSFHIVLRGACINLYTYINTVLLKTASDVSTSADSGNELTASNNLPKSGLDVAYFYTVNTTLGNGKDYRDRLSFIRICDTLLRKNATVIFVKYFLSTFTKLANDRVYNVRLLWMQVCAGHIRRKGAFYHNSVIVKLIKTILSRENDREMLTAFSGVHLAEENELVNIRTFTLDELDVKDHIIKIPTAKANNPPVFKVDVERSEEVDNDIECEAEWNRRAWDYDGAKQEMGSALQETLKLLPGGNSLNAEGTAEGSEIVNLLDGIISRDEDDEDDSTPKKPLSHKTLIAGLNLALGDAASKSADTSTESQACKAPPPQALNQELGAVGNDQQKKEEKSPKRQPVNSDNATAHSKLPENASKPIEPPVKAFINRPGRSLNTAGRPSFQNYLGAQNSQARELNGSTEHAAKSAPQFGKLLQNVRPDLQGPHQANEYNNTNIKQLQPKVQSAGTVKQSGPTTPRTSPAVSKLNPPSSSLYERSARKASLDQPVKKANLPLSKAENFNPTLNSSFTSLSLQNKISPVLGDIITPRNTIEKSMQFNDILSIDDDLDASPKSQLTHTILVSKPNLPNKNVKMTNNNSQKYNAPTSNNNLTAGTGANTENILDFSDGNNDDNTSFKNSNVKEIDILGMDIERTSHTRTTSLRTDASYDMYKKTQASVLPHVSSSVESSSPINIRCHQNDTRPFNASSKTYLGAVSNYAVSENLLIDVGEPCQENNNDKCYTNQNVSKMQNQPNFFDEGKKKTLENYLPNVNMQKNAPTPTCNILDLD